MFNKLGDLFSTVFDSVSDTLSSWSTATDIDSFSTSNLSSSLSSDSTGCPSGIETLASGNGTESDSSFGVGNAWGTTGADNQVFAESNSAFPASDFSSSFDTGSSWDSGSSCDSSSSFSSSTSSWD